MNPTLTAGSSVRILKGCLAREISRGMKAEVISVTPLGKDFSHQVRVTLRFFTSPQVGQYRQVSFFARHINRLSDDVIGMNDGNPLHRIEVRRA
jgi:hypothetical protein